MSTLHDTIFSVKDDAAYSAALQRMYEVTNCKEWEKLAEFLGVRLSILNDARRRKRIPPEILLTLLYKLNINPQWILSGEGTQIMQPCDAIGRILSNN